MELNGPAQQVWIFLGENDHWHGRPLYLAILELLKRHGCAGGTVLRGLAGFGAHSRIHTASLVELSSDLPIVVTFVDRADRVARVLPELTAMVTEGLITVLPVEVIKYSSRPVGPFPPHLHVADVMTHDVAAVRTDTLVSEIVTLLIDRALRALPVIDDQRHVVGIITDGDLIERGATSLSVAVQRALPLAERAHHVAELAARPQRAADLMTPQPVTLAATTPLAKAAATMAQHGLKRIPVVDEARRLIGIVSRSDLLATVAEGLRQRPSEALQMPAGAPTTVAAIMLRDVPTVHRDTPLTEVLTQLVANEKRRVVVIDDERHVVGIITDGDLIERAARRVHPGMVRSLVAWFGGGQRPAGLEVAAQGRTASDVMSSNTITVTADTAPAEAVRLMIRHRVKRLPVVDAQGRLVGLVGRAGVLTALSHGNIPERQE